VFEEVHPPERDRQTYPVEEQKTAQTKHDTDHEAPFEESGGQTNVRIIQSNSIQARLFKTLSHPFKKFIFLNLLSSSSIISIKPTSSSSFTQELYQHYTLYDYQNEQREPTGSYAFQSLYNLSGGLYFANTLEKEIP